MARPRRQFSGVEDINPSPNQWMAALIPGGLGVRERREFKATARWHHKSQNGVFDPLTHMHVLDAVANIDPDIELRAAKLTDYLSATRPEFIWDPITVGKVLSDLCNYIGEKLGEKHGLLEGSTDYKGRFYVIHHTQETAVLYRALRHDLMRLAAEERNARELGEREKRLVTPLLECPSVRIEWVSEEAV